MKYIQPNILESIASAAIIRKHLPKALLKSLECLVSRLEESIQVSFRLKIEAFPSLLFGSIFLRSERS